MLLHCTLRPTNPDPQIPDACRELLINSDHVAYWQPSPEGHARAHFVSGSSVLLEEAFSDVMETLKPFTTTEDPTEREWRDRPGMATIIDDVQRTWRRDR